MLTGHLAELEEIDAAKIARDTYAPREQRRVFEHDLAVANQWTLLEADRRLPTRDAATNSA